MPSSTKSSRRDFFSSITNGLHGAALATLLGKDLYADGSASGIYDLTPKPSHFAPKAKAVIQLFMNGGPSRCFRSLRARPRAAS
jgi:hypothetical protein